MKHNRWMIRLALTSLVLAALACNVPGHMPPTAAPTLSDAAVATQVAKTMQAVGDVAAATATPELVVTATSEPAAPALEGLRVAYSDANRDLWVWDEGEPPVKVLDTGDVVDVKLSLDGAQLLFARSLDYTTYSLWVMGADGGSPRELVSADEFEGMKVYENALTAQPFVYDWVPGQKQAYFVTSPVFEGPGLVVNDDLWLVDTETGDFRALLPAGEGGVPYFSPDGEKVMIATSENILLMNADGSGRAVVQEFEPVLTYSEYMYYPSVQWRSDSGLAAAAIPPTDSLAEDPEDTWAGFLTLAGQAQEIKSVPAYFLSAAVFNQQLNAFAYLKNAGAQGENRRELRLATSLAPGSAADAVFATGNLEFVAWAPDGVRFAYRDNGEDKTMLGQVGAGRMQLAGVDDPIGFAWIDDSRFLYLQRTEESWKMFTTRIGSDPVEVADLGPANDSFPTYSFVK